MPSIYHTAVLCASFILASCAAPHVAGRGIQSPNTSADLTPAQLCAENLAGTATPGFASLESDDIEIINWNIQKGGDPRWSSDLLALAEQPDLLLFQEAALRADDWGARTSGMHRSFAPGYRTKKDITGVMTASAAQPLSQCKLVSHEPLLRSPKATMISEYGLTDTDDTLLVVNVHSVNFTIGLKAFSEQIDKIHTVVAQHAGPVLLSGDFNTWRGRRAEIVQQAADSLGLRKLDFAEDHRKRVFGQPLDHIYLRGFEVLKATTRQVQSSDHNPMSVRLRL